MKKLLLALLLPVLAFANDFYTPSGYPTANSLASSALMRNEFTLIKTGFDKLPAFSGNANKVCRINSTATAMDVSLILDDGSTVTVGGPLTLSGATTFSGAASILDTNFSIKNSSDATKIIKFSASGITTGTTRTLTAPDASTTLVGTDTTQTLTNKTIGAATISGTQTGSGTPSHTGMGAWSGTTGTLSGTLTANGDVTIGDAGGDNLTINAASWTLGNSFTATRALGVAAAGTTTGQNWATTFSGDPGGATLVTAQARTLVFSGGNSAVNATTNGYTLTLNASAGTLTTAIGNNQTIVSSGAGAVTDAYGYITAATVSGSGNVSGLTGFQAFQPTFSSSGAVNTSTGFKAVDQGHATLITNSIGFDAVDHTAGPAFSAAYRSQMSSGTGKWGFYASGSANNAFTGNTKFGSVSVPIASVDARSLAVSLVTNSAASYTVLSTDYTIVQTTTGSTYTLPTASSFPNRKIHIVTQFAGAVISASSNVVPITGGSAGTSILAATSGKWATLQSNGTNWVIIAAN